MVKFYVGVAVGVVGVILFRHRGWVGLGSGWVG